MHDDKLAANPTTGRHFSAFSDLKWLMSARSGWAWLARGQLKQVLPRSRPYTLHTVWSSWWETIRESGSYFFRCGISTDLGT